VPQDSQTYRYVLLPNAYRIILPPLTSEFLNNLKNTSVALTATRRSISPATATTSRLMTM
jgi:ABC-type amino acid transport system permease subunit